MKAPTIFIPAEVMYKKFKALLLSNEFSLEDAKKCAHIFTENSLDGVYSHGVNRFARFIEYIQLGYINPKAKPHLKTAMHALEQWDGDLGPGPLNALLATERAIQLSEKYGIACIGLAHTNHWMRAGYFGREATKQGKILIAWTNTLPNMPAWGAVENKLGNNPLVIAVPAKPNPIVLDMAMSQYSYGKMEFHARNQVPLSYPGGFDEKGRLITDAQEILKTKNLLPVGFWKGTGLSLLLDLMAATISQGKSVADISKNKAEFGVSQIFVAINPNLQQNKDLYYKVQNILDFYKQTTTLKNHEVVYPGERVMKIRAENEKQGIPVEKKIWEKILSI